MRSGFAISFHSLAQYVILLGIGLILITANPALVSAQDTLESLQAQWKELDAKLAEKEAALEAEGADTDAIQTEFKSLLSQANEMIKKIEESAMASIKADPTKPAGFRAIMGILLNDAEQGADGKVLKTGQELIEFGINPQYFKIASKSERLSMGAREIFDELILRQSEALKNDLPRVKLKTTQGDIVLELFENEAPETVGNFISLVDSGFYNGLLFHRVMEDFMAQAGGYVMNAAGEEAEKEPGYTIECECYKPDIRQHFTGSLSMAKKPNQKHSGSSEFFITFRRTSHLDKEHTVFGRMIEGSNTLELITRTHDGRNAKLPDVKPDKIITAEVLRKRDHRYRPNKVGVDEEALDRAEAAAKAKAAAEAKAKADAEAKAKAEAEAKAKAEADAKAAEEKAAMEKKKAEEAAAEAKKQAAEAKTAESKAEESKKEDKKDN